MGTHIIIRETMRLKERRITLDQYINLHKQSIKEKRQLLYVNYYMFFVNWGVRKLIFCLFLSSLFLFIRE